MRLSDQLVLFVDVQSTGATPAHGRLLELAWCVATAAEAVDEAAIAASVDSLVLAGDVEVPARILKLTGIAAAEVAAGAREPEAWTRLAVSWQRATELGAPFGIAHFAIFEARFLDDLWARHGGDAGSHSFRPRFPLICTHQIARRLLPDLPSRSLRAMAGFFGEPLSQSKRASAHVVATARIWRRLCDELATREGIEDELALRAWLEHKAPQRKGARAYPIERTLRLGLPDQPGVYRMLAQGGRVLYVGKATSLRSRVNSYFRQRKGHASAKLELLTQVVDLHVTACETAIEAALLESDEIKRIAPAYNVALRGEGRRLGWFDGEFGGGEPWGRADAVDAVRVVAALMERVMGVGARGVLARGVWEARTREKERERLRQIAREIVADPEVSEVSEGTDEVDMDAATDAELLLHASLDTEVEREAGPEDVAKWLWEMVVGAGARWSRARRLARLRDAVVGFKGKGERMWRVLTLEGGQIVTRAWSESELEVPRPRRSPSRASKDQRSEDQADIVTYDRVSVLASELVRLANAGGSVVIRHADEGVERDGMDGGLSATRSAAAKVDRAGAQGLSS